MSARRRRLSPFWRIVRFFFVVGVLAVVIFAGTVAGVIASYSNDLPDINRMADYQPSRSTRVYARDGSLLANLYHENRTWVTIDSIPIPVRNAFVATEDRNFYHHHGIDPVGIVRAAWADYRHQQFQGASTITQQLARALFLSNEVSVSRKIQEALLAIEIERYYTKDEILERYLNLIYFGSGAYGVEAAAHTYFGRSVSSLTVGQAAMLAGLPAAPSNYSPYVSVRRARERQSHVLDRMVAAGYITTAQSNKWKNASLALIGERSAGLQSFAYPYFTTYATHQLEAKFGAQNTYEGGLQVYTTLDPRMQKLAQSAVDWGVAQAKAEGIGAHQAALVSIRPSTGEIVAMVGGAGAFTLKNQFNRAWQSRRQPGSSFKVFVYTAAVDSGEPPNTLLEDSPISYPMGDGTRWAPQDDDHRFFGAIPMRYALAQSRNVVAVRLAEHVGIDKVIEYARRMGVMSPLEANLSLALGTSGVSPLDMAAGYATLANQGIHIDPSPFRVVRDAYGSAVLDNQFPQETEVVSAGTAFIMSSMMQSVINEGTGFPNAQIGRPAAGKTGTTSDYHDAWFVGFTPDLVTAVWIGNDDYRAMSESYGGNIPARTWARFMKAALAHTPKHNFPFPSGEVRKIVLCTTGKPEYFLAGTEPARSCGGGYDRHRASVGSTADLAPMTPHVAPPISAPAVAAANAAVTPRRARASATHDPLMDDVTPPPLESIGDGTRAVSLDDPVRASTSP